uniref:VWFA domain-containing protein n=1 Tax=Caenorhabditis tropicalis TaxID=1561998 RepID=A0A1I7TB87_9PELO
MFYFSVIILQKDHGYNFFLLLCLATVVICQYPIENSDDILPYSPPGYVPPMPPTDPPGYDSEMVYKTTPSTGLRAPPVPTWTKESTDQSLGQQVEESNDEVQGSGDVVVGSGRVEESSGEGSGSFEGSADEGSGSGEEFFEGSGAQDDFPEIMHALDGEAAVLGVNCPSDTIFIIDATSSVSSVFKQYITFLEKVIEGLDIQPTVDHVGAIIYSSEKKQRVKIRLGEHKNMGSLMKAVDNLPFFSGITATGQALKFAASHTEGRRENITLNYVVLTDGYSYDIIESGARLLRAVPNSVVYAVTIGEIYLKKEFELISGNPDNVLIGSMSYGTLVKRIKQCEARVKALEHRNEHPNLVRPGEFLSDRFQHRGKVDENVETKPVKEDYVREDKLPVKDCLYDVGIIFDSSGSLEKNFQKQLSLASQLVEQMPIAQNATRVGIVQFAGKTKVRVLVDFVQNKTANDIVTTIEKSPFYSGTTFTNHALIRMAELFRKADREKAKKQLLLFTDGYSAEDTAEGIEALKSQGVVVYTVGISTDKSAGLNMRELHGMATTPEHYYDSSDFFELLKHFPALQYC